MRVPSKIRRITLFTLLVLLALELGYVATGVLLVRSGQVARWLNRHPEKLQVTFGSAWTVIPGVVHFSGVRILWQGRGSQLEGVIDSGRGVIEPLELLGRRVHVVGLRGRGVEFRVRPRPRDSAEAAAPLPSELPPIRGLAWEPSDGAPRKTPRPRTWAVVFTDAYLQDVRDVWVYTRHLTGAGSVEASVTVGSDRSVSIRDVDVRFDDARVGAGGREAFSQQRLRVRGEMASFDPRTTRGLALASLATADIELDGRIVSSAEMLGYYLRNAPWVRFEGGEAGFSARLHVERGRVLPGSTYELSPTELRARFAGFTARGHASTRLEVEDGKAGPDARLTVTFDTYGLSGDVNNGAPLMEGTGLRITARSPASLGAFPPADFSGRIELGRAEFRDLSFVNALLPAGFGLRVAAGAAKADGAFDVGTGGRKCTGTMQVTGDRIVLRAGGVDSAGGVALALAVPDGDLTTLRFSVAGSRLDLKKFSFATKGSGAGAANWSGSVRLPAASLDISQQLAAEGRVSVKASDTRPLVAFLSADKPLAGWQKRLLSMEEISGDGRLRLGAQNLAVDDYVVTSGKVGIRARLRISEKGPFGKVLASYGAMKAGIELKGAERDLKVVRPERWFEERPRR